MENWSPEDKVEISIISLIELLTEDPEKTVVNKALLEIANDLLHSAGVKKLGLFILKYYVDKASIFTFKEKHEDIYKLFTVLYGVSFWRAKYDDQS